MSYQDVLIAIQPADARAIAAARAHCDSLVKPLGSLGRLEDIACKLAGISGQTLNRADKRAVIVMAADNGVYLEGVAASPQEFTRLQAINMTKGICGVSVFARAAAAELTVVDIGICEPTGCPAVLDCNICRGTANIAKGPAMTRAEAEAAIEVGFKVAGDLYKGGVEILATGEMGIGNTTTTSTCLAALTSASAAQTTGRGAGLTDEQLAAKVQVVKQALAINQPDPNDPIDVLAKVGGLDIAGLVGCFLAAASLRRPILIDGVISAVAALIAVRLAPDARDFMFATHCSAEPSYSILANQLKLEPFLDLNMRLGEGSGAALAFPLFSAACTMMAKMATFVAAGFDTSSLVDIREDD